MYLPPCILSLVSSARSRKRLRNSRGGRNGKIRSAMKDREKERGLGSHKFRGQDQTPHFIIMYLTSPEFSHWELLICNTFSSEKISVDSHVSWWIQQDHVRTWYSLKNFLFKGEKYHEELFLVCDCFIVILAQEKNRGGGGRVLKGKKKEEKKKENKKLSTWITVWVSRVWWKKGTHLAKIAILRGCIPRGSFPLYCGKEMDGGLLGLLFKGDWGGSGISGSSKFLKQTLQIRLFK